MDKRIFNGVVAIILCLLVFLNVLAAIIYNARSVEGQRADLLTVAKSLSIAWEQGQMAPEALESKAREIGLLTEGVDLRLTLLRFDGQLVYDSLAGTEAGKELTKEEFRRLAAGEDQVTLERVIRGGQKNQIIALATTDHKAALRLMVPLQVHWEQFIIYSAISLGLTLAALYFISRHINRETARYRSGVELLSEGVEAVAGGTYDHRVPEITSSPYSELSDLTSQFNEATAILERKNDYVQARMARLSTILNTIIDPLFMVDADKNLIYANRTAKEVFGRTLDPEEQAYPQILLTHSEELDWLIEECLQAQSDLSTIVEVPTLKGSSRYQALFSAISIGESTQGVIVALHDLTAEEEAAAFRRDFVANVTHELKTPLTSLRGFIETLRNSKDITREQATRFLDIMDVEAQRLENLIDDILSLSEVERGKIKEITSFDLNELIDEVIVLLDDKAVSKQVSVYTAEDNPETLMIKAERDRIKQILINLVDNAIKYNNEHGHVVIFAQRLKNGLVQILVEDDGPGIEESTLPRIFERFYRQDTGRSRDRGGTGLGLSIVKHIAQLYNGEARVESKVGEGTRFIITLEV
ncbi:MAG: ATP-binding protein [Eubacteriales bacterium]|nr:ATP-binding protein [Eubacteriales bacterium]